MVFETAVQDPDETVGDMAESGERLRDELQTIWWSLTSAGQLAEATRAADPQQLPAIVADQLTTAEWRWGTGVHSRRGGCRWLVIDCQP